VAGVIEEGRDRGKRVKRVKWVVRDYWGVVVHADHPYVGTDQQ